MLDDFPERLLRGLDGGSGGGCRNCLPIDLGAGPVLATGDRFVSGGPVREALAARADLVDMEGYAVAAACRAAAVDVRLVKLVSDDAGDDAHHTWAETVGEHAETLAGWVREHLS